MQSHEIEPAAIDSQKNIGTSAANIPVAVFRQIHHLPLVWQGDDAFDFANICKAIGESGWNKITKPIRALSKDRSNPDPDVFNEFVYFHDFARKFLYPVGEHRPFRLFEKKNPGKITVCCGNNVGSHEFTIERLTLHVFRTRVAMLTVETVHNATDTPLTLAQVQTIIDQFRRSYTPYWDSDGNPQGIPRSVGLSHNTNSKPQRQEDMVTFLEEKQNIGADAPLLEPWKSWVSPLTQKDWSDPSDERVPVMSFILLEKNQSSNRDTLNQIKDSDWYRLAEADGGGDGYNYNPEFLGALKPQFFYDRFFPDEQMPDYLATRHIFGGAHYCIVSVDDPDDPSKFSRNILQTHFRRHYEKMALAVRFEFTSLLAFSNQITKSVALLEGASRASVSERRKFRAEVLNIHEDFLEFTHRYHFTGITSQIQGAEMYDRWRTSLDLDRLYSEVRDEITSASEFAMAVQSDEAANRGNQLSWVGIVVGTLVAAPPLKDFTLFSNAISFFSSKLTTWGWDAPKPYVEFFLPVAVVSSVLAFLIYFLKKRKP